MDIQGFLTNVLNWVTTNGIKVLIALVVLLIGFRIITVVARKLRKKFEESKKVDTTISKVICHTAEIALKVLLVVALIGYLGIDTSGITALIASLGVGVGLVVNGALGNVAGGVLILITRPYKVGDFVTAGGYTGTVEDIRLVHTKILTLDNKVIYIPNGSLSSGSVENYSEKDLRRVDFDFTIGGNDPELVKSILLELCMKHELVLFEPEPFARITDYAAGNGVILTLRCWCKNADYWTVRLDLLEQAQVEFEKKGVVVPFNQLDVHIKQ